MVCNLKALREEAGISQRVLAKGIGVSQQSINAYENYDAEPSIAVLSKLAVFFDTSVDYLIGNSICRDKMEMLTEDEITIEEEQLLKGYHRLEQSQKDIVNAIIQSYQKKPGNRKGQRKET